MKKVDISRFLKGINNKSGLPIAIVIGLGEAGLAVARSVSKRGICVIGVLFGIGVTPSLKSRHLHFLRGPDFADQQAVLNFYTELGECLGSPAVLLPTGDENVLFIHRNRDALIKHFHFYVWDSIHLEELASKINLAAMANQYDLPTPMTIVPKDRESLIEAIKSLRFPCIIKPEYTHLWQTEKAREYGIYGIKALPVETSKELLEWYDKLERINSHYIIQQMIVGPDENHVEYPALVELNGEIKAEFVAYKIRVAPAHFGMGCYVESMSSDEVVKAGRKILKSLEYRGLAMVQFKRDTRDNKLYLLEINPRFTVWTGLPVACGIDFPYYYYMICIGEKYTVPDHYIVGKKWWNPLRDVFAMKAYIQDGTWTLKRWIISLLSFPENAYFTWDDPIPGVYAVIYIFKRILGAFKSRISNLFKFNLK